MRTLASPMRRTTPIVCGLLALLAVGCQDRAHRRRADAGTESRPRIRRGAKVVVVGGGIAGLVAAYELEKAGATVRLLEATDAWGGRIATAYYGPGLEAEFGMQEIWDGNPLLDVARELGVALDGEPEPPFSSVVLDGRLQPFVQDSSEQYFRAMFSDADRRALTAWMEKARKLHAKVETSGIRDPEVVALRDVSFAQWLEREHVPPRVAEFLRLTIECELAADWTEFSALVGLIEFRTFLGEGVPNYHVTGGNQRLVDALVEAIHGEKTLGAVVTRIERHDGGRSVEVHYVKDHVVERVTADRVVVAVPFYRVHQIEFSPPLDESKWEAVTGLQRGHYVVVHFHMDKDADRIWNIDGVSPFPVLTNGPLGVIYGVNERSPADQPLQIFTLLIYGPPANRWHMVARETKLEEALAELDRMWPGFRQHVRAKYVYSYHPAAIPVWPPGRAPIDEVGEGLLQPDQGVYFAGDYTWSAHSEGAARSAIHQAEAIARELREAPR